MVIATVFLTIIGMTSGFVLGERHRDRLRAAQVTTTTGGFNPDPEETGSPEPSGPSCPDETIQMATKLNLPSDLYQIFKIVTKNGTTVWICQDGAGSLYYQSKTGGVDEPLVQGENGLFLSQVIREGDREYLATAANGNRFVVNEKQLEVHFAASGKTQVNAVETVG
ncbi:hypothetical protein Adu01nite_42590 [Paractinoplanes durhamensis]|uniref:Serine/threonine protein kinase n=1 Tax=Paractinoplanes durhamensis TaxID=113563 RepID=A0ABQ3Z030_9ACTN|nr:hypothetical protein Adu01nite_42590 [Actinoplanes durhamensis]